MRKKKLVHEQNQHQANERNEGWWRRAQPALHSHGCAPCPISTELLIIHCRTPALQSYILACLTEESSHKLESSPS